MKGVLNNPKVVSLLALAAFGVAGKNILAPIISSPTEENLVDVPAPGLESDQITTTAAVSPIEQRQSGSRGKGHSPTNQEIPNIGWELHATRDPFTPIGLNTAISAATQSKAEIEVEQPQNVPTPEHNFALSAIAIGATFKLALIDNELVRRGNVVADTEVATVEARALELRDRSGDARKLVFESSELRQAD